MNNIYKVIFNKARGLLMVVCEKAKSRVKATSESTGNDPRVIGRLKPVYFSILIALGLVTVLPLHAQIVSGSGGPKVGNAQNGVQVVDINKPSTAGVSHNKYSRFDVQKNGAILNNSRTNSQTQLAGWLQGNPNLANGAARVILNEVNSQNPTHLRGYLEVAGQRAQVIVANPAGITCNGCGFINATRATMTTGDPIMNMGKLEGFNVRGGRILIEGKGLDASQSDYADLIARSVQINAGVWAKEINVTAGANKVNTDNSVVTPIAANEKEEVPQVGIDVGHLGGMYAGKITLVGTEHGVGVRNAGEIGASAGELIVSANGRLENTGAMQGTTALAVKADEVSNQGRMVGVQTANLNVGKLENDGYIIAGEQLAVKSDAMEGSGELLSQKDLSLEVGGDLNNSQAIQANGNMDVTVAGTLTNESYIGTGQQLNLKAENIDNTVQGEIVAATSRITAENKLTNRGVIDGSSTYLTAGTVDNLGTGSIFGDHVAIKSNKLLNRDEGGYAAVIAARDRMDLGASEITNQEHALLFSMGDMKIGGDLDDEQIATGLADVINNESATIEAMGNMHIAANELNNKNMHLKTERVYLDEEKIREYAIVGNPNRWGAEDVKISPTKVQVLTTPEGSSNNFIRYDYTRFYDTTVITETDPAKILAGGNLILEGGIVNNKDSQILAGGTLYAELDELNNIETPGYNYTWDDGTATEHYRYKKKGKSAKTKTAQARYKTDEHISEFSLGTVEFKDGVAGLASDKTVGSGSELSITNNSLFKLNPDAKGNYLIETNPLFADYGKWISSDYMLSQLGLDPTLMMKRLGDGFYEQKMVQEQVAELTGRRFLDGYASNEDQYKALLDNATTYASAWELIPGVALTDAQVAQLTSDIVWLVEQTVTLPNGDTTVALVPQVYLMPRDGDLNTSGSLIAANVIDLDLKRDVTNQGTIAGREIVAISADSINNLGGRLTGAEVDLYAAQDINNIGGVIDAINSLQATASGDINVVSTTVSNDNGTITDIGRVAGLYITGDLDGVQLTMNSGNDINIVGGVISNRSENGETVLLAKNNINLDTVQTEETNTVRWNGSNYRTEASTSEIGSNIHVNGNLSIEAGNDIDARGAYINSEKGNVLLLAQNDVNLEASENTIYLDEAHKRTTKKGFLSKTKTSTKDVVDAIEMQGSIVSGKTVEILAGNDINVTGSHVVSDYGTDLYAGNDINVNAATDSSYENHYKKTKKSGVFGGGGLGITIGTQTQSNDNKNRATYASASTIGSTHGDVNILAGNNYTQTGSHIQTPLGDINITAKKVDIVDATETNHNFNEYKFKQSGISVHVTNPIISAIQTGSQMYRAQEKVEDGRMKALAGATAGLAAKNAYDAVAKDPSAAGGVGISITLGTSKQNVKTTTESTRVAGSTLDAGNNINITATGGGENSDITIRGSQVKAGNDVNLKADNDVNLLAAANTSDLDRKSSGSSAGVGVAIQVGSQGYGIGFTANASASSGKAKGNDLEWTNTHVSAGNKLNIESGRDTNMVGAVAEGKQVTAEIGRDLNIASLQDMSEYHSKDKHIGGSVTVGIGFAASGSAGQQKIDSSYASVTEQSGIRAGDDGFQINVKGNTDLTGAIIASTDKAVEDGNNSLSTGTLTTSNIKNKADYKASKVDISGGYTSEDFKLVGKDGSGGSGGVGSTQKGESTTGGAIVPGTEQPDYNGWSAGTPGAMLAKDDDSSTTYSGISAGEIVITNEVKQKELTGQDSDTVLASLNRDVSSDRDTSNALRPIFNEEEILAGFEITGAFGNEVSQFLNNRAKEAEDLRQAALNPNLSIEEVTALLRQASAIDEAWGQGGTYRQVMAALVAASSGNVSNSVGEFGKDLFVNYIQQNGAKLIGDLVAKNIIEAGSAEHTALHAIAGCAGAAASSQSCGAGAMGAASAGLLTKLLEMDADATPEQMEARKNLVASLVTGIAEISGLDAATANNSSIAAIENNHGFHHPNGADPESAARKEMSGLVAYAAVGGLSVAKDVADFGNQVTKLMLEDPTLAIQFGIYLAMNPDVITTAGSKIFEGAYNEVKHDFDALTAAAARGDNEAMAYYTGRLTAIFGPIIHEFALNAPKVFDAAFSNSTYNLANKVVAEKSMSGAAKGTAAEAESVFSQRMANGRAFDKAQSGNYEMNQIRLDKGGNNYVVLDSYNVGTEIVSRKYTQLADIELSSAQGYIREFVNKYSPGNTIKTGPLAGEELVGKMYLEIPVQNKAVPQSVLDYANKNNVIIRDINGKIYNPS